MKYTALARRRIVVTFAALLTVTILTFAGAALAGLPFGSYLGQFRAVSVYSNETVSRYQCYYTSDCKNYVGGVYTGVKWQCVEYVRRYYLTVFRTDLAARWTGDAYYWYENATAMGLDRHQNGVSQSAPQVGDILASKDTSTGVGHVAIVKRVTDNRLYTAQQNFSNDAADLDKELILTRNSNGTYTVSGYAGIQGWLRLPNQPVQSISTWHPDGTLLLEDSGAVWLIENGRRRALPSDWAFASNGFNWYNLVRTTPGELSCFDRDPDLAPGTSRRLVKGSTNAVFLITDRGYKRGFASATAFEGLGFRWADVATVPDSAIASYPDDPTSPVLTSPYPDGTLIQSPYNSTQYVITNGKKRGIATASAYQKLGYSFTKAVKPSPAVFDSISEVFPVIDDGTVARCR